jgi:hypothetical protein
MVVRQPVEIIFGVACKAGRGAKMGPDLPPLNADRAELRAILGDEDKRLGPPSGLSRIVAKR